MSAGSLVSPGGIYTSNCLSDGGYMSGETTRASAVRYAATLRSAAAAIIAADNAAQLVENYRDQRDIARRMTTISKEAQDQLRNHFWPREEEFLNEFANPDPVEEVEVMGRRYAGRLVSMIAKQFAEQIRVARCNLNRYCTSGNKKVLQDLLLARANAFGNARVMGRNMAFTEYRARMDVNYKRRIQAVSWGNGMIQQAAGLYASALSGYQAAGKYLAGNFNQALGNLGANLKMRSEAGYYLSHMEQRGNSVQQVYAPYGETAFGTQTVGGRPPVYSQTAFGYQSVNGSFSDINANNIMTWDQTTLDRGNDTTTLFGGSQQEKWNIANMGNEDFVRTGTVSYPVIGVTGGTVIVSADDFPLMNARHKSEGIQTGVI